MAKRYWLMKVEPEAYSIDDLERDGETTWEGVRNYQVRNMFRDDFQVGDGVLFYASNADPSGVTGLAEVSKAGYFDHFALDKKHKYFDPKSDPDNPRWYMVDVKFKAKFDRVISLAELREVPELSDMLVLRKGQRLSVMPVTKAEFDTVKKLAKKKR